MAERFVPLQDRVVIRPDESPDRSPSGLHLVSEEKPQTGTVVSVGEGAHTPNGVFIPTKSEPGDRVLFGKFAGSAIEIDGVRHLILRESDLFGYFEAVEDAPAEAAG